MRNLIDLQILRTDITTRLGLLALRFDAKAREIERQCDRTAKIAKRAAKENR